MSETVSIVIPTHNRAALLPTAVESARAAGSNIEVIVVDDASTDDTPAVCAELKKAKVVRLPKNKGLAAARNAGVKAASGDIIAFLDDDDVRFPGSIDRQLERLRQMADAALVYGQVKCKQSGSLWPQNCPEGDVFWTLLECNFIPVTSVMVRRKALLKSGLFDERLLVVEDWDLWLRLAAGQQFAALPEPVALYNEASLGSGQLSSNKVKMSLACALVQKKALSTARAAQGTHSQRKDVRHRLLRRNWFELSLGAAELLLAQNRSLAAKYLVTAFRLEPGFSFRNSGFRGLVRHVISLGMKAEIKAVRKTIYADLNVFEQGVRGR